MKAIDSIIESAQNEEELQKNLIKINKVLHGESFVNSAIDMSESPEELTDAMVSLARKKRVTKEDQSIVLQTIYSTLRNIGYALKPLDWVATPFTESARQLPKMIAEQWGTSQTPPVDIVAPYRSGDISKTFGLSAFITDLFNAMGMKVGPVVNFNETEFASNYPIAANILSEITNPANMAAMAAEGALLGKVGSNMVTDPAVFTATKVFKIQDKLSDWYLSAIQKDPALSEALKNTGKWNDVVRYFTLNKDKLITPFNKQKAIDFLTGPVKSVQDIGGQTLSYRDTSAGEIGRLSEAQGEILAKIPTDKFTIDPIDLNKLAKKNLPAGLMQENRSRAEALIDQNIPYYDYDQNKIQSLKNVEDYEKNQIPQLNSDIQLEKESVISSLDKKKAGEFVRLKNVNSEIPNPQYREDLQWLSQLPLVEGDNIFPKTRVDYVTDITYPDDPMSSYLGTEGYGPRQNKQIVTTEESFKTASPTIGQNQKLLDIAMGKQKQPMMIDNPNYYALKAEVDNKILLLNSEIESVRKLNLVKPENYNRLSSLMKQRDNLVSYVNQNIDPTFSFSKNPVESYKQYVTDINQLPATSGTDIRRRGNELIDGTKLMQHGADIEARQAAGKGLRKAGALAEQDALGYLPSEHDRYNFNMLKNEQSLALNARELISGNAVSKPGFSRSVPVGDMVRGAIREVLSIAPEYGVPIISGAVDKLNTLNNAVAPALRYSATPANIQSNAQPSNKTYIDFVPRGVPLNDPMMKAAASEYIMKDKSNHPARNADRIMKLINEGIFED